VERTYSLSYPDIRGLSALLPHHLDTALQFSTPTRPTLSSHLSRGLPNGLGLIGPLSGTLLIASIGGTYAPFPLHGFYIGSQYPPQPFIFIGPQPLSGTIRQVPMSQLYKTTKCITVSIDLHLGNVQVLTKHIDLDVDFVALWLSGTGD